MEMKVEIISREIVKPADPTPVNLKHYKLSLLDQLCPLHYVASKTCYAPPTEKCDEVNTFAMLKDSLAKALSLFYPLAGRLAPDESSIDCKDQGIPFFKARCCCPLSSFLDAPNLVDFLSSTIPLSGGDDLFTQTTSRCLTAVELPPLLVQVTVFKCGGVIIGTKGIHKIFDATSCGNFLKCWSDFARGRQVDSKPDFTSAMSLFPPCSWAAMSPPREPIPLSILEGNTMDAGTCLIVKVFQFSHHSVSILQAKAKSNRLLNPTRLEAVTAFVWKHAMVAAATSKNQPFFGPSVVTHAVNIRPRTDPKLSPNTFGNLVIHAIAYYKGTDTDDNNGEASKSPEPDLPDLVSEVARALAEAKDAEFLSKLEGGKGSKVIREYKQKIAGYSKNDGNIKVYKCTSWSRVGLDYPDFGFLGMPIWSGSVVGPKNRIVFTMNPDRGIDVSLALDKNEMESLQSNPHFLQFASLM